MDLLLRRHIAFWKFGFFNCDTALDTNSTSTSTRNEPKINPSKMAKGVSTRQWILFHHPTTHIYHIYYEDLSLVGGDHDLEIFRVKN